jgi:hypothetical protein
MPDVYLFSSIASPENSHKNFAQSMTRCPPLSSKYLEFFEPLIFVSLESQIPVKYGDKVGKIPSLTTTHRRGCPCPQLKRAADPARSLRQAHAIQSAL